jgi:hypothetical protein
MNHIRNLLSTPSKLALRDGTFPKHRRRSSGFGETPDRLDRRKCANGQTKDEERNVEGFGGSRLGACAEMQHGWVDEAEGDTAWSA